MDALTLKNDLPEFANETKFPTATVNFWLGVGAKLLNADRWGELLDHGLELFTAHHLVVSARDVAAAAGKGVPGTASGVVSSKSVGNLSMSYDTGAGIEEGAGHWNLSTYGTQFIQLARMVGAGPVQL
jgi:hypothetical protein